MNTAVYLNIYINTKMLYSTGWGTFMFVQSVTTASKHSVTVWQCACRPLGFPWHAVSLDASGRMTNDYIKHNLSDGHKGKSVLSPTVTAMALANPPKAVHIPKNAFSSARRSHLPSNVLKNLSAPARSSYGIRIPTWQRKNWRLPTIATSPVTTNLLQSIPPTQLNDMTPIQPHIKDPPISPPPFNIWLNRPSSPPPNPSQSIGHQHPLTRRATKPSPRRSHCHSKRHRRSKVEGSVVRSLGISRRFLPRWPSNSRTTTRMLRQNEMQSRKCLTTWSVVMFWTLVSNCNQYRRNAYGWLMPWIPFTPSLCLTTIMATNTLLPIA